MVVYFRQVAWFNAYKDRKIKEIPPLNSYASWLKDRVYEFGLSDWSWQEFRAFRKETRRSFLNDEVKIFKELIITYHNGLQQYSKEGTPPPYMKEEARKRLAVKQDQQARDTWR